jgi:hypothetical protein
MTTYLVRTIESKRMIGIFSAGDSAQLFFAVDEALDPFRCEYLRLTAGEGVFMDGQFKEHFAEPTPDTVEVEVDDIELKDAPSEDRRELQASLKLANRLLAEEDFGWREFTRADANSVMLG